MSLHRFCRLHLFCSHRKCANSHPSFLKLLTGSPICSILVELVHDDLVRVFVLVFLQVLMDGQFSCFKIWGGEIFSFSLNFGSSFLTFQFLPLLCLWSLSNLCSSFPIRLTYFHGKTFLSQMYRTIRYSFSLIFVLSIPSRIFWVSILCQFLYLVACPINHYWFEFLIDLFHFSFQWKDVYFLIILLDRLYVFFFWIYTNV